MSALQIVPGGASGTGGVAAFARVLGEALHAAGLPNTMLAANEAAFAEASGAGLGGTVLLHYANYGYDARGCPEWLVAGLERWKAEPGARRLVTLFHEVYASGPPWRSSFWLGPRQRRLAERLARLSDAAVTTLERYRELLAPWRAPAALSVLPVPSTVGEPSVAPALASRPPRLAVFGGAGNRERVFSSHRAELAAACAALGVEEIVEIGAAPARSARAFAALPVRAVGALSDAEASRLLLECRAGVSPYGPAFLAKSTAFAAYCAHGLLPVCLANAERESDGLMAGRDFWCATDAPPDQAAAEAIARAARAWYAGHRLAIQGDHYRRLLEAQR